MNRQVMILSFWNPVDTNPQQGVFIQDQAEAVCRTRDNVIFLRVNVLPSSSLSTEKQITETDFHGNRRITIDIRSFFWKAFYVNPWLLAGIINKILRKKFPEIRPALIHSNVIFPCGIAGYLIAAKTQSSLIISEHWSKSGKFLKHPVFGGLARKVYLSNSHVICVSEYLAGIIREGTGHKNIIVIPNIISTDIFSYTPKRMISDELECTCVANWKPPKRLDLIVGSLKECALRIGMKITLNVAGNGYQTEDLKNAEMPSNLNIKWHGYLDKPQIAVLLQRSHFFLHASDTETFSLVTAEALATGTPVVVSDKGALPELIHNGNGLLAENNSADWTRKICEIINRTYDNKAIADENQDRFAALVIAEQINEIYKKILGEAEKSG